MKTARCQLGVTFEIFFIRLIQIPFPHNPIIFPSSNIGIVQTYTTSYNLRQCVINPPLPSPIIHVHMQNINSLTFQAISVFPRMSDRKYICFHDWWPLGNSAPCPEHCCVGASHLCPGKSGR